MKVVKANVLEARDCRSIAKDHEGKWIVESKFVEIRTLCKESGAY